MWRSFADWAVAFLGMFRELQEHRVAIRDLTDRVRNLEETLRHLAQEKQHTDEVAALEREKLLPRIENEFSKRERSLLAPRGKKSK